jgi:hypothetical protein
VIWYEKIKEQKSKVRNELKNTAEKKKVFQNSLFPAPDNIRRMNR